LTLVNNNISILVYCWVLVAHAYDPNYIKGRHQEDWGSRPAWEKSETYLKNTQHIKGLAEWGKWKRT
jgi:hypothetical protein